MAYRLQKQKKNLTYCPETVDHYNMPPVGVSTADVTFEIPQDPNFVVRIYAFDEKTCEPHKNGNYIGGTIDPASISAKVQADKPFAFELIHQYRRAEFLTPANHCRNSGILTPKAGERYLLKHTLEDGNRCVLNALEVSSAPRTITLEPTQCRISQF